MSNPKVFEFAKEVGMTPLALMDKIREWHLPVKSHMAELEPTILETIKIKLSEPQKASDAGEKKPAARKKAAAPAAKAAAPAKAAAKAAPKVPAKAAAKATKATPAAAATAAPATGKSATPVVRRKVKAVEEPVKEEAEQSEAATSEASEEMEQEETLTEAEVPAASVAAAPVHVQAAKVAPEETDAPVQAKEETASEAAPELAAAVSSPTPKNADGTPSLEKKFVPPARKKEVAIGNSGVASAPRRNIIGRMDLSRVAGPQAGGSAAVPLSRPGGGERTGGPRPTSSIGGPQAGGPRPKGNLRTGFIQASSGMPDVPPMSDDRRRGGDDKRKGGFKPGGDVSTAKPAEEGEVKHFDAAEFRKREMVFQPKKKKGVLARPSMQTQITKPKASKRVIKVNQSMKVGDLAMEMGLKAPELIKKLMKEGVMASMNMALDFDTISLIAPEFGFEAVNAFRSAEELIFEAAEVNTAELITRSPVVTIMGHAASVD